MAVLFSAALAASSLLSSSTQAEEQHRLSNTSRAFTPCRLLPHWAHTPAIACTAQEEQESKKEGGGDDAYIPVARCTLRRQDCSVFFDYSPLYLLNPSQLPLFVLLYPVPLELLSERPSRPSPSCWLSTSFSSLFLYHAALVPFPLK